MLNNATIMLPLSSLFAVMLYEARRFLRFYAAVQKVRSTWFRDFSRPDWSSVDFNNEILVKTCILSKCTVSCRTVPQLIALIKVKTLSVNHSLKLIRFIWSDRVALDCGFVGIWVIKYDSYYTVLDQIL